MKNHQNSPQNACTEPILRPLDGKNSIKNCALHGRWLRLYILNCLIFKQNENLFSKNLIKLLTFQKYLLTKSNGCSKFGALTKQITVLQGVGSTESSRSMYASNLHKTMSRILATRSTSLQSPHLHDSFPIGTIEIFLCDGAA
jgi:hypothetical protein